MCNNKRGNYNNIRKEFELFNIHLEQPLIAYIDLELLQWMLAELKRSSPP